MSAAKKQQPKLVVVKNPNDKSLPKSHKDWGELLAFLKGISEMDVLTWLCASKMIFSGIAPSDNPVVDYTFDMLMPEMIEHMASDRNLRDISDAISRFYERPIGVRVYFYSDS